MPVRNRPLPAGERTVRRGLVPLPHLPAQFGQPGDGLRQRTGGRFPYRARRAGHRQVERFQAPRVLPRLRHAALLPLCRQGPHLDLAREPGRSLARGAGAPVRHGESAAFHRGAVGAAGHPNRGRRAVGRAPALQEPPAPRPAAGLRSGP